MDRGGRVGAVVGTDGGNGRGVSALASSGWADAPGLGLARSGVERRRSKALLGELAIRLINAPPEDLDETIEESLEILTRTLAVSRCGLAQLSSGGRSLVWTQGFAMPGIPPWKTLDLASYLPWFTEQVRTGRPLVLSYIPEDLPPEATVEAELSVAIGLMSNVTLPLKAGSEVLGALGVETFHAFRSWTPELVSSLDLLASAFANALQRLGLKPGDRVEHRFFQTGDKRPKK